MKDRIPKYPGRVQLTPVEGQANVYDMVRADEPEQVGTPLSKASLLTDETAALYGLGDNATIDEVLQVGRATVMIDTGAEQYPARILVQETGPLDQPPNTNIPGPHFVHSYGSYSGITKFANLYKAVSTCHAGRYSYAHDQYHAYRLDAVTREVKLLADLEGKAGVYAHVDRILAVDDQYIYFAKHSAYEKSESDYKAGGNILKFDHSGKLVETGPTSGEEGWVYNPYMSVSSDSQYRNSIMADPSASQTENYILLSNAGVQVVGGKYMHNSSIISKRALKVLSPGSGWQGGVSWEGPGWNEGFVHGVYFGDYAYFVYSMDKGYNTKFCKLTDAAQNGYTIINDSDVRVKLSDKDYSYVTWLTHGPLRKDERHCYYLVTGGDGVYYSVITEEDIDTATGEITIAYGLDSDGDTYITESALFQNYDPIKGDFNVRGTPYQVHPTYVAPTSVPSLPSGFSELIPFEVDDFLHLYDGEYNFFRVKNRTQYIFDRAEVVEE